MRLERTDADSTIFHLNRGDFVRWISEVIGNELLTANIANLPREWRNCEENQRGISIYAERKVKETRKFNK